MGQSRSGSEHQHAGEAERRCAGWDRHTPAPLGTHYLLLQTGTGRALRAPSAAGTAHSPSAAPAGQRGGFQRLWLLGKTLRTRSLCGRRARRPRLQAVPESDGTRDFAAWEGSELHLRPRRRRPQCAPETRCAVSRCRGSAWSTWGPRARPAGSQLLPTPGAPGTRRGAPPGRTPGAAAGPPERRRRTRAATASLYGTRPACPQLWPPPPVLRPPPPPLPPGLPGHSAGALEPPGWQFHLQIRSE